MKTILVTGATGFIGRNLVELLLSKNYNLIVLLSKKNHSSELELKKSGIKKFLYEEDLDSNNYFIDICIHLASYGVEHGKNDFNEMINVNIALSAKIMNFCIKNKCKNFINTGSCFEYGENNSYEINETQITYPNNLYAATKSSCDLVLRNMVKGNSIKYITLRPFGVFGMYESKLRLLPLIINHGNNKQDLKLTKGEQIRDYLYVKDVALAYLAVVETIENIPSNEVFNICSSKAISIREFIESVIKVFGFDQSLFKFGSLNYRENESMRFVGSNEKLIKTTFWSPKYKILDALEDYKKIIENSQVDMERLG